MNINSIINTQTIIKSRALTLSLGTLTFVSILCSLFYVFLVVPNESVMGPVQRIFYYHVSSAVAAYLMVGILFVSSICYLRSKANEWDMLAYGATCVAFLFCSIVLGTGMIWGHSAWNTWWRWEPRLVSFLILWLILFSYLLLRNFTEGAGAQQKNFSAVLGIISAVNVPIVVFSVKLLEKSEQLHPQVLESRGLMDFRYVLGLIISCVAINLLALMLLKLKLGNLLLKDLIYRLHLES